MAIRDHFRLDVLVRRAAELQERDAELGELERVLSLREHVETGTCPDCGAVHGRGALYCWQCGKVLMERVPSAAANGSRRSRRPGVGERAASAVGGNGPRSRRGGAPKRPVGCERAREWGAPVPTRLPRLRECGSPLAGDQRYCLSCGARNGPRAPALERILEGLGSGGQAPVPAPPLVKRSRSGLPSPLTAAVLTLAMLGFGTVAGAAASNPSGALERAAPRAAHAADARPARRAPRSPPRRAPSRRNAHAGSGAFELGRRIDSPPRKNRARHPAKATSIRARAARKGSGSGGEAPKLPPVKHVFLIVLADQAYAQTFGPESPAPYIAHTLEHQGELLVRFYGVAHEELADEVALISGLGPTPQTAADCPTFTDIVPGQANSKGQYTGRRLHLSQGSPNRRRTARREGAQLEGVCRRVGLGLLAPRIRRRRPDLAGAAGRHVRHLPRPLHLLRRRAALARMRPRRRRHRRAGGRPEERQAHAGALLHRARPLPRRPRHPVRARCAERAARRRNVPAPRRPRDPRLPRLPTKAGC